MKKKSFWTRENYWLNIITIIMTAMSIFHVFLFSNNDLKYFKESVYPFMNGLQPNGDDISYSLTTVFSDFMGRSQSWYLMMVAGIAVIGIVLFRDMKVKETQEWMGSLPISHKEIFMHQWFRGMIAYTIPHLVFAAGTMIIYYRNIGWIRARYLTDINWQGLLSAEAPIQYIKLLFMVWLWATACYSIFFFMQTVCKKSVIAALSGFGIIVSPLYMSVIVYRVIGYAEDNITKVFQALEKYFILIANNGDDDAERIRGVMRVYNSCFSLESYCIRLDQLIVIAVMLLGCMALAFRYFHCVSDQKQEGIFSVLWVRYVILAGLGLCIGMGIFMNLMYYRGIGDKWMFILGTVLFAVLFVIVIDRLMKRRGY
ncbi:MAG: hypothetical protein Q4E73_05980 [Lachnospiraceae bacterium]|nr:hypothetical protein [Lachnospiraceae bacterium]